MRPNVQVQLLYILKYYLLVLGTKIDVRVRGRVIETVFEGDCALRTYPCSILHYFYVKYLFLVDCDRAPTIEVKYNSAPET